MSDALPRSGLWAWAQSQTGESAFTDLTLLILFVVLAIRALLSPAPGTSSAAHFPVRVGAPRLVGMSASDAAEPAQLLGSGVAHVWTAEPEE